MSVFAIGGCTNAQIDCAKTVSPSLPLGESSTFSWKVYRAF
jgi:hypothetical protein